jgi:ribose transport system permease protein
VGAAPALINGGNEISNLPSQISTLGSAAIANWVYYTVVVAAVVCIVMGLVLHRTRFGLRTYAVGSNNLGARRAGINVDAHLVKVYVISGFLGGLAGMMVMANFSVATPIAGQNDELNAIAAVVIGGASLFGGRGHMLGTVVGTFIIALLVTGLVLIGVSGSWQEVATGIIIVAAVAVSVGAGHRAVAPVGPRTGASSAELLTTGRLARVPALMPKNSNEREETKNE